MRVNRIALRGLGMIKGLTNGEQMPIVRRLRMKA